MKLVWEKDGKDWRTSDGFGVLRIQYSRKTKKWYLFREMFGKSPLLISSFDSKEEAKTAAYLKKNPSIMQAPELPASMRSKRKPKPQAPSIPKKNPALRYFLKIQKKGGPVMTWNGKSFSDNGVDKPHPFARALTAQSTGKKLLRQHPILEEYKCWVDSKFVFEKAGRGLSRRKAKAMRGGTKSNPSKRVDQELDQAAKKLEDFTGHPVQHLESAYSRSTQKTGLIVGELDLIGYRATRDGKSDRYGHRFKKNSRPLLAVTSDGKQLHIVGGQYEFTEAGIEDR